MSAGPDLGAVSDNHIDDPIFGWLIPDGFQLRGELRLRRFG